MNAAIKRSCSFGTGLATRVTMDRAKGTFTVEATGTGEYSFNVPVETVNGTDQPTVTFGPGTGGVGEALWLTYDLGGIRIQGAPVTGLGAIGTFGPAQLTGVAQFGHGLP